MPQNTFRVYRYSVDNDMYTFFDVKDMHYALQKNVYSQMSPDKRGILPIVENIDYSFTIGLSNDSVLTIESLQLSDNDFDNLPNDSLEFIVDSLNEKLEYMIDCHSVYVTEHIDSTSDYKRIMIDGVSNSNYDSFNRVLCNYGLTLSTELVTELWDNFSNYFTTIVWRDGYNYTEQKNSITTLAIGETELQLSYDIPDSISEKLNYFVKRDLVAIAHWGYFELSVNINSVMDCLASIIE